MLSLPKLLTLILLILAVWYGFKWVSRVNRIARERRDRDRMAAARRPAIEAEEMEKCRACGVYVPAGTAASCGRADCPYR